MAGKKLKNIIMMDVLPPKPSRVSQTDSGAEPDKTKLVKPKRQWIIMAVILIAIFFSLNAFNFIRLSVAAPPFIQSQVASLKTAVQNFELASADKAINLINKEIKKIIASGKRSGLFYLAYLVKPLPKAIEDTALISQTASAILNEIAYLKKNALDLIWNQQGTELISRLEKIKNNLELIAETNKELKINSYQLSLFSNNLENWSGLLNKNYIPVQLNIYRAQAAVNALLEILKNDDQHFLLLFQNQSEIRPAGGFIGSFGDLVLNRGNLESIKIDDIYNADRQLHLNIIPPQELQGITKKWGARDANWFFDFPTSAKKVSYLLEQNDIYAPQKTRFQGVIAINTNVLKTMLQAVGPIALPSYNLTINSEGFLAELQREVEAGRDKKPGQNPKKILSVLSPLLMEKLKNLSASQKEKLPASFLEHLQRKDIMFYSPRWELQNLILESGIGGAMLELADDFSGDYLAIVNANIGGGKTDAFIHQNLNLRSRINSDGKINNELVITRKHSGANKEDWWYKIANKNYLKILVPPKSQLKNLQGNDEIPTVKKSSYPTTYEKDPDLIASEMTASLINQFKAWLGSEFGKTYFAAWLTVPAGQSKSLFLEYESGIKLNIQEGLRYQFIFEKQSGVDDSLEYSITAPPGYIWQESGKSIFEYGAQQIKAREIIELTLIKPPTL